MPETLLNEPDPNADAAKVAADAAAAETLKNETPEAKAAREKADADKVSRDAETPEQKAAREKKEADDKKANEVPEKYEDFKFPEGVEVDAEALTSFQALAKELKLPQAAAQKLVDFQAGAMKKAQESAQKSWDDLQNTWVSAAKADKEFGGAKFDENIALAKKAKAAFGNDEFSKVLDQTGVGNNPEMIRFLVKVAKTIKEDEVIVGGAGAAPKDVAARMFPSMVQK